MQILHACHGNMALPSMRTILEESNSISTSSYYFSDNVLSFLSLLHVLLFSVIWNPGQHCQIKYRLLSKI